MASEKVAGQDSASAYASEGSSAGTAPRSGTGHRILERLGLTRRQEDLGLAVGFLSWMVRQLRGHLVLERLDLGRRIGSGFCCMREVSTSTYVTCMSMSMSMSMSTHVSCVSMSVSMSTHVNEEGFLLCVVSSSPFLTHATSGYLTCITSYPVKTTNQDPARPLFPPLTAVARSRFCPLSSALCPLSSPSLSE